MEKRALMKFILYHLIFLCVINTSYSQSNEIDRIKEKITIIKDYPFGDYKGWSVIKRAKKEYVFDYIKSNPCIRLTVETDRKKAIKRISYVLNGSLEITNIENLNLTVDSTVIDKAEVKGLYCFIKNTNLNQFQYIKEHEIYMFDFDEIVVIYSPSIEASKINRFKKYRQIDKNWFYYVD
jgi:hypothetical protein